MDKLQKLNSLLNEEEEREWTFRYTTKEIIDQMGYMRAVWDDSASKELWKEYAIPFQDTSSKIVSSKQKALNIISELRNGCESLFNQSIKISELSEEISEKMKVVKREHTSCDRGIIEGKEFLHKVTQDMPILDNKLDDWENDEESFKNEYSKRQGIYNQLL